MNHTLPVILMRAILMRAILMGGLLFTAGAQIVLNPPAAPGVITVDVDLVNVICSVRDRNGGFVKGLNKEDFEIREDGRRQEITHFARDLDSPVTVALLLDVSGSVATVIGEEKTAGRRFFDEVLRPGDKAMLVGFADRIAVWQDLTGSKPLLQDALERAGPHSLPMANAEVKARGGTLLYDAVLLVADQKLKRLPNRKAMVLITDGEDNGSIASLPKAVQAAQQADAVIYGIHYRDEAGRSDRDGLGTLEKLSNQTGGRAFHVNGKMTLSKVFAEIAEEMRNQYGVGFKPPDSKRDGSFHKLELKTAKPGLKVQARTGYYR